jgi:hypothetical protein
MIRLTRRTGVAVFAACLLTQVAAFADEERSSSVKVSTPGGSASTSVHSASNAAGASTTVQKDLATPGQATSKTYHASAGPNGAHVSKTKTNVQGNADGSISASRQHESHTMNDAGSAHHVSNSSTTLGADGSTAETKQEAHTTSPQ